MQCPIDGTPLVMTERSGVEIDYCPACRGVWLDRGELDKIIERSANLAPPPPPQPSNPGYSQQSRDTRGYHDGGKRKKKDGLGSLLGDIFDF